MKKYLIIISFVIILSILSSFALEVDKEKNLYFNDIKIEVEQEVVDLKGKEFIYEGHIYVPLRNFAESLGYFVKWDGIENTVTLTKDTLESCNPLNGEYFVYGQITSLNYIEKYITIEQHLDNNSREIYDKVKVKDDVITLLQRKNKEFIIDFEDVKIGDVVGLIINKYDEIRGIIIFT